MMHQNVHSGAGVGKLTSLHASSGEPKYLSPPERVRFYEVVGDAENLADKSLFITLIYCGCRISEALNLLVQHIDKEECTITFVTLKQRKRGQRIRVLHFPSEFVGMLLEQAAATPGDRIWTFSRWTARRRIKIYMEQAGLGGVKATNKGLRHAFAIHNLVQGVPLTTISKWLGHATIERTKIYLDFAGPEERELAMRAWPHLLSSIPPVSVIPATSETEIETFDFENQKHSQAQSAMNAEIKRRRDKGWSVSQIEHLTGYDKYDGRKHAYTTAFMVVFVKTSAPMPPFQFLAQRK